MTGYECPRCLYKCKHKNDLRKHINKKEKCLVNFNGGGIKVDIKKYEKFILNDNTGLTLQLLRENLNLQKQVKNLSSKKTETKEILINQGDNNVNNIQNNNNYNLNISILPWNDINFDEHLEDKDFMECLSYMRTGKSTKVLPSFVEKVHFNAEHPELHNMFITNLRNNMAMVHDGNQWCVCGKDELLDTIINQKEATIGEWAENKEDVEKFKKYITYWKKYQDKSINEIEKRKIKNELKYALYNNRDRIDSAH